MVKRWETETGKEREREKESAKVRVARPHSMILRRHNCLMPR